MELPPRPTLFDFHGVSMTKYFTDNWVNIQSFKARPDDIVLVSYPKAGEGFSTVLSLFQSPIPSLLCLFFAIVNYLNVICFMVLRKHMGLLHAGPFVL